MPKTTPKMLAVVIGAFLVIAAAVVYAVAGTSNDGGNQPRAGSTPGTGTVDPLPSDFVPPASNEVPDPSSEAPQRGPDKQPPTTPANFDSKAGDRLICLTWKPSKDNVGVVGYRLFRDGEQIPVNHGSGACGEGYEDRVGCAQKTYTYKVVAYDAAGNASKPAETEGGPPFCSI
jgi:hypothetical protein